MDNLKNKAAGIAVAVTLSVGGAVAIDQTQLAIPIECDVNSAKVENLDQKLKTYRVDEGFIQTREMTPKDRAKIKGCEIAKIKSVQRTQVNIPGGTYDVEIVSMSAVDGGVEVFARAWLPDGTQIGFGVDGSVDVERFRFFNPPVLVEDPNGSILLSSYDYGTGNNPTRKFREDTHTAILQSLAHTILVKKEKFGPTNIVVNRIGNTTSTFYTGAGDGHVGRINEASWTAARDTADGDTTDYTGTTVFMPSEREFGSNYNIFRGFFPFDTSALPDSDTISSATFSVWPTSNGGVNDMTYGLVQTSQAANTTLANGDFDALTVNSPTEGATRVSLATTGAYSNFTLNASGIGWISATSFTKLGLRQQDDIDNTVPATGRQYVFVSSSENTGTTQDPKLVVEHSGAAADGPTPGANDVIWFN